ncbi:MAG TPA: TIGR00730 family Rossman fold protein [Vicinamibacterales bacterium]|nr:TIGR00730 family Rossman fold protein [Vicinamibacterales bacterium]
MRLCVFCGSSLGANPAFAEAARVLGTELAQRRIGIVYGGGNVGLMGVVADAALAAGGEVIGVIPHGLVSRELAHQGLSHLYVVESMHERKALMAELSEGFLALPGGFGTLEEFCEVVTWTQLGVHAKACGLLNVAGYYDGLLSFLAHALKEGFLRPAHFEIVVAGSDPLTLVDRVLDWRPPPVAKWISRSEA